MEAVNTNDSHSLSSFTWKVANVLRGYFKHTNFARIIIPLLLLRRLGCLLEPPSEAMLKCHGNSPGLAPLSNEIQIISVADGMTI